MNRKLIVRLILLSWCAFQASVALGAGLEAQRQAFLQAEKLIDSGRLSYFPEQLQELKGYPLYPVLRYQWLRKHLQQRTEIQQFFTDYGYTRYADLLRRQWLDHLADTRQWRTYIRHYEKTDDSAMECHHYWAKYQTGLRKEALIAAKKLWTVGYSQPKACDPLLSTLMKSEFFSRDMIWERFALALKNGKEGLAGYVRRLMSTNDQKTAEFWLKIHNKPALVADKSQWQKPYPQLGEIFAHGVERLAGSDVQKASVIWDSNKSRFNISPLLNDQVERRLGLALAYRKNAAAYSRLNKIQSADETVREWRVRAALLEGDWQHVEQALTGLTGRQGEQPRWQYWRGRALAMNGHKEESEAVFTHLAADRSLFGFLAADIVKKPPRLSDRPIAFNTEAMKRFEQLPAIQIVAEFNALGRINDARRQWWYLLSRLEKDQILMAAKLAQQWGWTQTAIFTVAKAEHWDDVGLRFPIDYEDAVKKYAGQQELDPAIVFGLIRRESVFDQFARSPAGARGLMQIMPQTGRQIARSLKEKWSSVQSLFNPSVNVKYGTYYYKKMLDRFDGHFALAAAAYNAGPGRVDSWLPLYGPMPADIWIETIPFKETREYVTAVLGYAIIYQQRMNRNAIKIRDLMRDILPG
ncbi:MAG: transglycosylase SLT domain-containing protein [Gammaproteobacteria bacterium]